MTTQDAAANRAAEIIEQWFSSDSLNPSTHLHNVVAAELRAKDAEIESLRDWRATVTARLQNPGGARYDEVPELVAKLRADQNDWRKGVELIASALGEQNPPNLSCVRLAEVALTLRAENESLQHDIGRYLEINSGLLEEVNQAYIAGLEAAKAELSPCEHLEDKPGYYNDPAKCGACSQRETIQALIDARRKA